jgi:phosphoribosyl 1,2-cyclic phosphodiesterase
MTCKVCATALEPVSSNGKAVKFGKNKRRNTSVLIRYAHTDGRRRSVLIDCGKSFYESAINWFLEYDLKEIDAVLLTHGHADAMMGLDDLRMWTAGKNHRIQESVNLYLDRETMKVVETTYPYLVDQKQATGSGEVGALNFHVLEDPHQEFTLFDELKIQPFQVQHGFYSNQEPYYALGFRIGQLSYVSDCSHLNERAIDIMKGSNFVVMDALKDVPHTSHFSFEQSIEAIHQVCSKGKGLIRRRLI